MKQSLHQQAFQQESWPWPLPLPEYDNEPSLRESEYAELEKRFRHPHGHIPSSTRNKLARIVRPMGDVLTYIGAPPHTYKDTLHIMLLEIYRRGTTFWAWSLSDWQAIMCEGPLLFAQHFWQRGSAPCAGGSFRYPARVGLQPERALEPSCLPVLLVDAQ